MQTQGGKNGPYWCKLLPRQNASNSERSALFAARRWNIERLLRVGGDCGTLKICVISRPDVPVIMTVVAFARRRRCVCDRRPYSAWTVAFWGSKSANGSHRLDSVDVFADILQSPVLVNQALWFSQTFERVWPNACSPTPRFFFQGQRELIYSRSPPHIYWSVHKRSPACVWQGVLQKSKKSSLHKNP